MTKFIRATTTDGEEHLINMSHIISCRSTSEGVEMLAVNNGKAVVSTTLDEIQEQLEDKNMTRIGEAARIFGRFIDNCGPHINAILSRASR